MTRPRSWQAEFPQDERLIYLNHAAVAPWPRRTAQAVTLFAQQNLSQGALDYPAWLDNEKTLRVMLQLLINAASVDDIALLKNTSEGLSFIASGLDWQPGDNIVISAEEFPSNRIVWEALADKGVCLTRVALRGPAAPEQSLINACDANTRLLAISSVQYASGLKLDLSTLGKACAARGILFCVDAIQSLGALPFDVQACAADFVVADAHKWLLGPEGIALFYVAPRHREHLRLTEFGWHMVEDSGNYNRLDWTPARSARRFECGSPNMLGIHAFHASLSLLLEIGIGEVERRLLEHSGWLCEAVQVSTKLDLRSDPAPERRSGIVNFSVTGIDPEVVVAKLRSHGILCAPRGGGVRFSPHFYNTRGQLERAIACVESLV
jgi:cysteine desulfurase / selenocysteine lyase